MAEMSNQFRPQIARSKDSDGAAEANEELKLPPILLMYRDNDLFQNAIPKVVESLQAIGRTAEIKSFPRTTSTEDIKAWFEQNPDKVKELTKGKKVITDRTVGSHIRQDIVDKPDLMAGFLDQLFQRATEAAIGKSLFREHGPDYFEEDAERSIACFSSIVKRILENGTNRPDLVYVSSGNILDHSRLHGGGPEDRMKAMDEIKSWLVAGGIAEETIILENWNTSEILESVENATKTIWAIRDRHAGAYRGGEKQNVVDIQLPLEDFVPDVVEKGLLVSNEADMAAVQEEVEKILEKVFGQTTKE